MSSDYKYCLGLKVEATVELGHRVKSQCFRHLENIQVLTHWVNCRWISTEIINETSPEYLVFVQKCQAILNKGFVLLWTNSPRLHWAYSSESWLTGRVFKMQSEIHVQFTRNISLNLCKNIRKLFRKLWRFQILLWAWSRGNGRAFLTYFCRSSICVTQL